MSKETIDLMQTFCIILIAIQGMFNTFTIDRQRKRIKELDNDICEMNETYYQSHNEFLL